MVSPKVIKNIEPLAPAERLSTVSSPFMVNMYYLCNLSQLHKALEISMLNQGRTTYFFVSSGQNLIEITKCMLCSLRRKKDKKEMPVPQMSIQARLWLIKFGVDTSIGWA